MLQTTNQIFNTSLYEQVVPTSLLAWQRVRVANMLATSGSQWAELVALSNSGTYNNQYMVFDSSRFMVRALRSPAQRYSFWRNRRRFRC